VQIEEDATADPATATEMTEGLSSLSHASHRAAKILFRPSEQLSANQKTQFGGH
jgi:hypothetical protein